MQKDAPDDRDLVYTFGTEEGLPLAVNDILKELVPIAPAERGFEAVTTLAMLLKLRYACEPSILFMSYVYNYESIRSMLKSLVQLGIVHDNDWPFREDRKGVLPGEDVLKKAVNLNVVYMRVSPNVQQLKLCLHAGKPFLFLIEQELVLGVGYDDAKQEFLVCRSTSDDDDDNTFFMSYDHPSYQDSDFWFLD